MSRLKTISDKLDYIAMGKLNAEQMEYICEINQEINLKDIEIERLKEALLDINDVLNSDVDVNPFCEWQVNEIADIVENVLEGDKNDSKRNV